MLNFALAPLETARNAILENSTLAIAIGATALVGYWITKKVFKLALYGAVLGAGAWYWYFNIRA